MMECLERQEQEVLLEKMEQEDLKDRQDQTELKENRETKDLTYGWGKEMRDFNLYSHRVILVPQAVEDRQVKQEDLVSLDQEDLLVNWVKTESQEYQAVEVNARYTVMIYSPLSQDRLVRWVLMVSPEAEVLRVKMVRLEWEDLLVNPANLESQEGLDLREKTWALQSLLINK